MNSMMRDHIPLDEMEDTVPPSQVVPTPNDTPVLYEEFKDIVFKFFEQQDYECNLAFNEGYSTATGEDNKSIDVIINLNSLIYNYCCNRNKKLRSKDKENFHNLFEGIQLLTRSMSQYDDNSAEKVFVAHIVGYVLKLMRNFYHA